jgi:hypothetical protein
MDEPDSDEGSGEYDFYGLFHGDMENEIYNDDVEANIEELSCWKDLAEFATTIGVESIDGVLIEKARIEVPSVIKKILQEIPANRARETLTPNDFFNVWFRRRLLNEMVEWLKRYMREDVPIAEIEAFIKVQLLLNVYQCSPGQFYDSDFDWFYTPLKWTTLTHVRYKQIFRALSGYKKNEVVIRTGTWKESMSRNKELDLLMEQFRIAFAEIGFVENESWVTFDDDLIRLRSRLVALAGFSQINNPAKGMGVIHHGAISVVTRLYLAGHIQQRGQSTLDCVTLIQRALCGVLQDGDIDLKGTLFFCDRGYGGPDGVVNQTSMQRNAMIAGTSRRMPSFPFTFGNQHPGPNRDKVMEDGALSVYIKAKEYKINKNKMKQYAFAFRNGLGRVVLMQATSDVCHPGEYVYVTKGGKDAMKPAPDESHRLFINFEKTKVTMLTEGQGSPEWFMLRRFRITSTTAYELWKAASNDDAIGSTVAGILDLLCIA